MKKLITMIGVAAAAFGLYADDDVFAPAATSAEVSEWYEEGQSVLEADETYWYMAGDAEDAAVVKAYGEETAPAHTALYNGSDDPSEDQARYVALDSETPVFRTFAEVNDQGTMDSVEITTDKRGGIIADQLVKFSAFEDDPTDLGDAKIAVWVKTVQEEDGDTPATNHLMISTAALDNRFGVSVTNIDTEVVVNVADWHHLKITAIQAANVDEAVVPGFVVELDDTVVAKANGLFPANTLATYSAQGEELIAANKLFPSRIAYTYNDAGTLQGVAFKGSGAVDDITVAAAPVYAASTTINVTLAEGVTISAVNVGSFSGNAWTFPNGTATGTITLAAPAGKLFLNGLSTIEIADVDLTNGNIDLSENTVEDAKAKIGTVLYLTLKDAVDAATNGVTVTLMADVAEKMVVPAALTITLDMNGKTLQNAATGYTIDNAGNLTIVDSAVTKGTITHLTVDKSSTIRNLGTLEISDITVGGTYIGVKNDEGVGCNGGKGYGELTLNGVTYNGDNQAVQNWGKATLNGGTFGGAVCTWAYNQNKGNVAGETTILGGTFNAMVAAVNWYDDETWPTTDACVTIKGGTFNGEVCGAYAGYTGEGPVLGKIVVVGEIASGTINPAQFKNDASAYCEDGYETVKLDGAEYYTVRAIQSEPDPTETKPEEIPENVTAGDYFPNIQQNDITNANAKAVAEWCQKDGVKGTVLAGGTNIDPDAFLLDCANTSDAVETAKASFVITSITQDENGEWAVKVTGGKGQADQYGNGYVNIVPAEELSDAAEEGVAEFFKAELTFTPVKE